MKKFIFLAGIIIAGFACNNENSSISTGSLLNEMVDLTRLTRYEGPEYKTVQFSSYDRRSKTPGNPDWFANHDGFGGEPIPGFEAVVEDPDSSGTGVYLICDVQQPGAIVRLWTARISGNIRLYIDDVSKPVYEGGADAFFRRTIDVLSDNKMSDDSLAGYRQFDAVYFPLVFARRCRMEWIGNLKETHFYHVGIRLYEQGTKIKSFIPDDFITYRNVIQNTSSILKGERFPDCKNAEIQEMKGVKVPSGSKARIIQLKGSSIIRELRIKAEAADYETVLRKCVLNIIFDDKINEGVHTPLGDFFAASPGINPYRSLPMEMDEDSFLICRFEMPFKKNALIEIENFSNQDIEISGRVVRSDYKWKKATSMYFNANWQMDYGITAHDIGVSPEKITDIEYFDFKGKGRIVGAAAFIYNPSQAITSWGNWWGEGDEKISVDRDTFPSFFGTGSEDYFNYSWSSSRLFSYAYCGQPRNDGPGNRGYVTNFRWHILDDIPFSEQASFSMELGHHGEVPGFCYGRIIYYYALPDGQNLNSLFSREELRDIYYDEWSPIAYKGSAGNKFYQAEELVKMKPGLEMKSGNFYAESGILEWKPSSKGDKLVFNLSSERADHKTRIGITMLNGPECGSFTVFVNGEMKKFDGKDIVDFYQPYLETLGNHFTDPVILKKGQNSITLVCEDQDTLNAAGIDFIWIHE